MPMQTLSVCNSHPPLAPLSTFTKPLTKSPLFIFKIHQKTTKITHHCYRKFTVFAVKEDEEQSTPSWAKPGSEEPPPWARNEAQQSSSTFELPFFVYLLASAITAIAAIGSVFEYVNQKPVFGLLNSDSVFYAPVLGFFAFTGVPTAPTLPVLSRLDRLDRVLELLEEKHGKSRMFGSTTMAHDDDDDRGKIVTYRNCKSLSSALDDVHYKGTLIDRLAVLENRVLQLSLDMEEGSTSRSSSSTAYATKEEKEIPLDKCLTKSNGKGIKRRTHFKWMGWFAMRC